MKTLFKGFTFYGETNVLNQLIILVEVNNVQFSFNFFLAVSTKLFLFFSTYTLSIFGLIGLKSSKRTISGFAIMTKKLKYGLWSCSSFQFESLQWSSRPEGTTTPFFIDPLNYCLLFTEIFTDSSSFRMSAERYQTPIAKNPHRLIRP